MMHQCSARVALLTLIVCSFSATSALQLTGAFTRSARIAAVRSNYAARVSHAVTGECCKHRGSVIMQVWSDSRAVEDYKNLLDGKGEIITVDCASVIIGSGKLGTAIANLGLGDDAILKRGDTIPAEIVNKDGVTLKSFPIYVAVKENDLEAVLAACPPEKKGDLVILQQGCVEPLLKRYGACTKNQTQAVLYWKIHRLGDQPKDGLVNLGIDKRGDPKLAGESVVCGKWAGAFMDRMERGGYPCQKLFYNDWRRHMFQKLIFLSAFNLVGALHGFPTIGHVARYHYEEVDELVYELGRSLRSTFAVTMLLGIEERLMAYAEGTENETPTTMDIADFPWRNGFFYHYITTPSRNVKDFPDPCSEHSLYLEYGSDKGLFVFPKEEAPVLLRK